MRRMHFFGLLVFLLCISSRTNPIAARSLLGAASSQTANTNDLTIITSSLRDGVVGTQYAVQIVARDSGKASYNWTLKGEKGGGLPPGLQFTQAVCVMAPCKASASILGTPKKSGEFTIVAT